MRISDWSSDVCSSDLSNAIAASTAPMPATSRPGRPCPGARANSAVRRTRRNESGLGGDGGTCTYLLRPDQKITVATNISAPGIDRKSGEWGKGVSGRVDLGGCRKLKKKKKKNR